MAIDNRFDGFEHDSLPSVELDFSCKSSVEGKQPDSVVDVRRDGTWVRLPTTRVETRINKDGPADMSFTSRIDCPVTWGWDADRDEKVPIYEYVGAAKKEENAEFDVARVFYWNIYREEYQVRQFGYVSSVGPAPENGTFRFYIYDTSDLMKNIPVTKTYDEPRAERVAKFVAYSGDYGIEDNTPISVKDVVTTYPGEEIDIEGTTESTREGVAGWINSNVPILEVPVEQENTLVGEGFLSDKWLDDALHSGGHKHFRRNKDTLVDVMNWLTDEIGGSWYLRPTENGVILTVNNGVADGSPFSMARTPYYDGNFAPDVYDYLQGFNHVPVDVLNNTSLEDLKAINYLELNGESADSFFGINSDRKVLSGPLGAPRGQTNKYPHVEVTYPPLLERAGGNKLGPKPIESGKQILGDAKNEAVKKFKEHHEDNTDGSIEIHSLPSIRPYDYISAVPVCNDIFDAHMDPIQYEVNAVKHVSEAGERYTTRLGVSIALDESAIEVETDMLEVDPSE